MRRTYHHRGFKLEVGIQPPTYRNMDAGLRTAPGFLAVISISMSSAAMPLFPPLLLGNENGQSFPSKDEALLAGYNAAVRMVDDLY